mgnify:CR=1 FL=1
MTTDFSTLAKNEHKKANYFYFNSEWKIKITLLSYNYYLSYIRRYISCGSPYAAKPFTDEFYGPFRRSGEEFSRSAVIPECRMLYRVKKGGLYAWNIQGSFTSASQYNF